MRYLSPALVVMGALMLQPPAAHATPKNRCSKPSPSSGESGTNVALGAIDRRQGEPVGRERPVGVTLIRRCAGCGSSRNGGPPHIGPRSLSGLQQQFSDDVAAFEQRLGVAGFGERQAVVDQRADAAGGEVVQ